MSKLKTQDQGIIELLQSDYLSILIDSFLVDRKSQGLSIETIRIMHWAIVPRPQLRSSCNMRP